MLERKTTTWGSKFSQYEWVNTVPQWMLGQNRKKGEENKKRKSTAAKEQKKIK